jgi:hypothetical protein
MGPLILTPAILEKRAREGNAAAGKQLVEACRKGMCRPYWESTAITQHGIDDLLRRRGDGKRAFR